MESREYLNPSSRLASSAPKKDYSVPHDVRKDEDTTAEPRPIYDIAKECVVLFGKSPLQPKSYLTETISRCQRRFQLWTEYLGVFVHQSVNLDVRLKLEPDFRDLVMLLLDVLQTDLRRLIKLESRGLILQRNTLPDRGGNTSLNDGTLLPLSKAATGVLEGIVESVDRLLRLAARIRISTRDDLSLEEKITNFAKQFLRDGIEDVTRLILKSKFPKAESGLIMKLAKSIAFRRHRLLYQRHYHREMSHIQKPCTTEVVRKPNLMTTAGKSKGEEQHQTKVEPAKQQNPQNQSLHQRETIPVTELDTSFNSTFFRKNRFDWQDDSGELQDPTGSPVESSWIRETNYLKPPEADGTSAYAMCQLCFQEIQVLGNEDPKWWEKHVDSDMDHYICLSDNCEMSLCYFRSSDSWIEHMNSEHQSDWPRFIYAKNRKWVCPFPEEHNITYDRQDLLQTHLVHRHMMDFPTTDIQLLLENSRLPEPRDPDICPLCEESIDGSERVAQQREAENDKSHGMVFRWSDGEEIITRDLPNEEKEKGLAANTKGSINSSKTKPSMATHIAQHLKSVSFLSLWDIEPEKEKKRRYEDSRVMIRGRKVFRNATNKLTLEELNITYSESDYMESIGDRPQHLRQLHDKISSRFPSMCDFLIRRFTVYIFHRNEMIQLRRPNIHIFDPSLCAGNISNMEAMGFERNHIMVAMRAASGNPYRAAEYSPTGILASAQQESQQQRVDLPQDRENLAVPSLHIFRKELFGDDVQSDIPPAQSHVEDHRLCSYCGLTIRRQVFFSHWKEHFIDYAKPYICVFKDCPAPLTVYTSKTDWTRHQMNNHGQHWRCGGGSRHPDQLFNHRHEFIEHIAMSHGLENVKDSDLEKVADYLALPAELLYLKCEICGQPVGNITGDMKSHIEAHLLNIAFHFLPETVDADQFNDIESLASLNSFFAESAEGAQSKHFESVPEPNSSLRDTPEDAQSNDTESAFISHDWGSMASGLFGIESHESELSLSDLGTRLSTWGYIPEIAKQHAPLDSSLQGDDSDFLLSFVRDSV